MLFSFRDKTKRPFDVYVDSRYTYDVEYEEFCSAAPSGPERCNSIQ